MVKTARIITWVVFMLPRLILGQSSLSAGNNHIEVFSKHLQVSPYLETKSHVMRMEFPKANGLDALNYLSNFVLTSGVRVRYNWVNFQVGVRLPINRFDEKLGTTQNFSIGLSVVKRHYLLQTKYETFSGFYLQNTQAWLPNYLQSNRNAFYIRPDLKTQSLFTTFNYILNHKKFSNPAAIFQFERQKRAAFGVALGASHMYNKIQADSNLVPTIESAQEQLVSDTYHLSHTLAFQVGLMATVPLFSKKYWYLTASIIPGYSVQAGRNIPAIQNLLPSKLYTGFTNELRFGLGYNARKCFIGLQLSSFGNTVKVRDAETFIVQNAYLRISTGVRIGK